MDNQTNSGEINIFNFLKQAGDFDIFPYEGNINFEDSNKYQKLELSTAQKIYINALIQQLPLAVTASNMPQMYTLTFPEGLPHTLMHLKNGGFATSIIGADGKIVGMASLTPMVAEAAIIGIFTAMSILTGQFFLCQINKELQKINQKLDEIISFLYGDKKAELLSEVSFVKCAYENFNSIMAHEQQRIATISGLQQAKKIAMKDIEFYINDLENTINSIEVNGKIVTNIVESAEKSYQSKDCLDLSTQLYIMSSLMEIYYAQNHDEKYIKYVEEEMYHYIEKSEKRLLSSFSTLKGIVSRAKEKKLKDENNQLVDKEKLQQKCEKIEISLKEESGVAMRKSLSSALHMATQKTEYYLSNNGDVYSKVLNL